MRGRHTCVRDSLISCFLYHPSVLSFLNLHCLDARRKKKLDSGDSGSIKSAGSRFKAAAKAAALSSRINPKALASKAQEATAHLTVRERGREMD